MTARGDEEAARPRATKQALSIWINLGVGKDIECPDGMKISGDERGSD